jgi:hypothetical protein
MEPKEAASKSNTSCMQVRRYIYVTRVESHTLLQNKEVELTVSIDRMQRNPS